MAAVKWKIITLKAAAISHKRRSRALRSQHSMRVSLRPLVPLLISTAPRGLHRSSTTPTMSSIEVERKFEPPTDLEALNDAVLKAGGTQLGSKSFTDIYYDTLPGCSLTRRDTWLRCRDGAWELKLPVEEDAKRWAASDRL